MTPPWPSLPAQVWLVEISVQHSISDKSLPFPSCKTESRQSCNNILAKTSLISVSGPMLVVIPACVAQPGLQLISVISPIQTSAWWLSLSPTLLPSPPCAFCKPLPGPLSNSFPVQHVYQACRAFYRDRQAHAMPCCRTAFLAASRASIWKAKSNNSCA